MPLTITEPREERRRPDSITSAITGKPVSLDPATPADDDENPDFDWTPIHDEVARLIKGYA